jgi:hypothetical protein
MAAQRSWRTVPGEDAPRLRQVLAGLPQPEAADGRLVLAVDVTHWLRPDAVLGGMRTDRVMRKPVPVPWISPP